MLTTRQRSKPSGDARSRNELSELRRAPRERDGDRVYETQPRCARDGAAIIISSHLLHLLEEVCSHVLILKNGVKVIDGTLEEIVRKFCGQPGDSNLETVFFRATGEGSNP